MPVFTVPQQRESDITLELATGVATANAGPRADQSHSQPCSTVPVLASGVTRSSASIRSTLSQVPTGAGYMERICLTVKRWLFPGERAQLAVLETASRWLSPASRSSYEIQSKASQIS